MSVKKPFEINLQIHLEKACTYFQVPLGIHNVYVLSFQRFGQWIVKGSLYM